MLKIFTKVLRFCIKILYVPLVIVFAWGVPCVITIMAGGTYALGANILSLLLVIFSGMMLAAVTMRAGEVYKFQPACFKDELLQFGLLAFVAFSALNWVVSSKL